MIRYSSNASRSLAGLDAPRLPITAIVINTTAPLIASDAVEEIGRQDLQSPTVQPLRVGKDLAGKAAPSLYAPKPAAA
jgi:hypothetical protein